MFTFYFFVRRWFGSRLPSLLRFRHWSARLLSRSSPFCLSSLRRRCSWCWTWIVISFHTHLTIWLTIEPVSVSIRSFRLRTFLLLSMKKDLWFLIHFCVLGLRGSLSDHNDNHCYTDAPISDRLRLQNQQVRNIFGFSFLLTHWDRCHLRESQNPQSNLVFAARTRETDTAPTTLNRIEVTVHTAFEQHPTVQKSDGYSSDMSINEKSSPTGSTSDDDSSTIISTNEHMSHVVRDSPKLDH